jgi:hypothetical protein
VPQYLLEANMDYPLHQLSPDKFQALVCALAVKVLGPGIQVYGFGPDGHRDFTFDGRVRFPYSGDQWDGYGIGQVKHRQYPDRDLEYRTTGGKTDAEWAVTELVRELKALASDTRQVRKPDYYIFVTNVRLTGIPGKGGMDRVNQTFERFEDDLHLKGWHVWDYHKICNLLDAIPDVLSSYLPWPIPPKPPLTPPSRVCGNAAPAFASNTDRESLRSIVEMACVILRCDQISLMDKGVPPISAELRQYEGGFSKSTIGIAAPLFGVHTTDLIRWQGGVTTSSLVGSALWCFERRYFGIADPGALDYLRLLKTAALSAQAVDGGFGTLVQTRDTPAPQPHSSLRHTASLLSMAVEVGAPQETINRALHYLGIPAADHGSTPIAGLRLGAYCEDACPALALAWIHRALSVLSDHQLVEDSWCAAEQKKIAGLLASIDDATRPYWSPYAKSANAGFWTSLTALLLCPDLVRFDAGKTRVSLLLADIQRYLSSEGLPAYRGAREADIGMTALLALAFHTTLDPMAPTGGDDQTLSALLNAVVTLSSEVGSFQDTWSETLYPLLNLAPVLGLTARPGRKEQLELLIGSLSDPEEPRASDPAVVATLRSLPAVFMPVLKRINNSYQEAVYPT